MNEADWPISELVSNQLIFPELLWVRLLEEERPDLKSKFLKKLLGKLQDNHAPPLILNPIISIFTSSSNQ